MLSHVHTGVHYSAWVVIRRQPAGSQFSFLLPVSVWVLGTEPKSGRLASKQPPPSHQALLEHPRTACCRDGRSRDRIGLKAMPQYTGHGSGGPFSPAKRLDLAITQRATSPVLHLKISATYKHLNLIPEPTLKKKKKASIVVHTSYPCTEELETGRTPETPLLSLTTSSSLHDKFPATKRPCL